MKRRSLTSRWSRFGENEVDENFCGPCGGWRDGRIRFGELIGAKFEACADFVGFRSSSLVISEWVSDGIQTLLTAPKRSMLGLPKSLKAQSSLLIT